MKIWAKTAKARPKTFLLSSCFDFPDSYRWALAFYKLCALYEICRKTNYDNYAYVDSDVFVQKSFNDIWEECRHNILMYDIGEGLHSDEYRHFINEVWQTTIVGKSLITHYGGEFFAASRERAIAFSLYSKTIFEYSFCFCILIWPYNTSKLALSSSNRFFAVTLHPISQIVW